MTVWVCDLLVECSPVEVWLPLLELPHSSLSLVLAQATCPLGNTVRTTTSVSDKTWQFSESINIPSVYEFSMNLFKGSQEGLSLSQSNPGALRIWTHIRSFKCHISICITASHDSKIKCFLHNTAKLSSLLWEVWYSFNKTSCLNRNRLRRIIVQP